MAQKITILARMFREEERGSILVEFGLVLPVMLLFFGVMIEGGRMLWSYQTAVAGVRDAGRYLARITPVDVCTAGGSVTGHASAMKSIVENDIDANGLFSSKVTINSVTPSYTCNAGSYRNSPVAVAVVTANMTLEFPLANIMTIFGHNMSQVTTTFSDQHRIFGQ